MENTILDIKITGEYNKPQNIPLSELKEFLDNFEVFFSAIGAKLYPHLKSKEFNISLTNISEGSTNLSFSSDRIEEATIVGNLAVKAIISKDLSELPLKATKPIEYFKEFASKRNCHIELYQPRDNDKVVAFISPSDVFLSSKLTIKSETTLYGHIFRIGGKKPTASISLDDGSSLYVKIDINTAKQLATFLYQRIGFTGLAEWDAEDYSLVSFENFKLIEYRESSLTDSFRDIALIIGDAWKNVDVVNAISELRGEDLDDSLP